MSSKNSSPGGAREEGTRSSSSSISTRASEQQERMEAALSDLESSFERHSHSVRYTSHVLDIQTTEDDDVDDEVSSIGSRHSSSTAQWFLSDLQHQPSGDNDSQYSSGMMDVWQRQQAVGAVDQSVNLMDAKTAKYEEQAQPLSGLDSLKTGLESFCMPDGKTNISPFLFPTFDFTISEEKESKIRKINSKKSKKGKNQEMPGSRNTTIWKLLALCFLVGFISVTIVIVTIYKNKSSSHFEGEGIVTAVKTAEQQESGMAESKSGDSKPADNSFADFEAAANALKMEAPVADRNGSASHSYEVANEDVIFRPTVTLPAKTKARAILAILLDFQVSNPQEILQPNQKTAPSRALKWMSEEDGADLALPSFYYQSAHTAKMSRHGEVVWRDDTFLIQQLLQRYALAVFYFSLQPPDDKTEELTGDDVIAVENHQQFQKSWLSEEHVCHWNGIDCGSYGDGGNAGVESVHLSHVVRVNLTRHELAGTIPPELFSGALPDLVSVDLSHNHLFGILPEIVMDDRGNHGYTIKTSRGEYHLQFARNNSLVSSFSTDSELLHFDVSNNHLTGTIPPLLPQLKHCQRLFLNNNHFQGSLQSFLKDGLGEGDLEQFDCGNNLLTGSIPQNLFDLNKLQLLSLEGNFLSGSIPDFFNQFGDVVELHVNDNILEGSLPSTLGLLSNIERLWLGHNEFGGGIPSELGLCTNLKRLHLEGNFIRESPPSSLGNLKQLEELNISDNRMMGTMPAAVCDLVDHHQLKSLSSDCKGEHFECNCCSACF